MDFRQGNLFSNANIFEHINEKQINYQYSEQFYGTILRILNISVKDFYLYTKLLFPTINFLLFYYFSFYILKSRRAALLSSSLLFFGAIIMSYLNPSALASVFAGTNPDISLLPYGRFVNPLLTFPFFFLGLIFLYRLYDNPNTRNAIYFGLLWGISFYVYFYFWTFLSVIAGLVPVHSLIRKNFLLSRRLAMSGVGAFLIGAYYLWQMFAVAYGGVVEDASSAALAVFTASREIIISKLVLVPFIAYLVFLAYKKYKKYDWKRGEEFLLLLFIAAFIVVNQQVITGRLVEEGHFHWYTNRPVVFIALAYFFHLLVSRLPKRSYQNIAYAVVLIFLMAFAIGEQVSAYRSAAPLFAKDQAYGPVVDWLNGHSEAESVVLADGNGADIIAAYTHNNTFYSAYGKHYATTPLKRRINAFYLYQYLDNGKIDCALDAESENRLLLDWVYFKYTRNGPTIVPDAIRQAVRAACADYEKKTLRDILSEYRLDYVAWDKRANPSWRADEWDFLELVLGDGGVLLYRVE